MRKDMRGSSEFLEAEALFKALRQPGTGQISDATEVSCSADGNVVVFSGTLADKLEGTLPTRICRTVLATGETRVLTFGPGIDRSPKFSPDGQDVAFVSDRHEPGDFQLYLLDPGSGVVRSTPHVEGWVEYLHWSPDGTRILLGVAGHGADVSGGQGAVTSKPVPDDLPSWTPSVEDRDGQHRWRHAWIYELASANVAKLNFGPRNLWEATWCGSQTIVAVASDAPGEGLWYSASVFIGNSDNGGDARELYKPQAQLGWPAGSPSGKHLAIVEALCSDRWIVAGDLLLIESATGIIRKIDTSGVDVSCVEWRSDQQLLVAGHRGFETVIGLCDTRDATFVEIWSSVDISGGGRYVRVSGLGESGDCVLIGEGFARAPEIGVIRNGSYEAVKSFDLGYASRINGLAAAEGITWKSRDGLEVQGWLLRPSGDSPHPLVMNVHGGPVGLWRPFWLGRWNVFILMLINRGYAVFLPNPRGSSGRGQAYVRHVYGDMGGADGQDLLSGIDLLVQRGIADSKRLGVMGGSYGGFMTSWLITQDQRFAAAVALAPHTNQVTEHLLSNIPHFMALFLQDRYDNPGGKYFLRSPVMHARKAATPTLSICGALDRCTPPEEALQFHNALLENAVESVLVTYPEEGHGISRFPALVDYAARVVAWFDEHMSADRGREG
jgi:dipeptidyl aminopeptidase/acylaminoacyl peptidase